MPQRMHGWEKTKPPPELRGPAGAFGWMSRGGGELGARRRCRSKDPQTQSNRHRVISASPRIVHPLVVQGPLLKIAPLAATSGANGCCAILGSTGSDVARFCDRSIDRLTPNILPLLEPASRGQRGARL